MAWFRWPLMIGAFSATELGISAMDLRTGNAVGMPEVGSTTWVDPNRDEHVIIDARIGGPEPESIYYVWSDLRGEWIEMARFSGCVEGRDRNGRYEILARPDCETRVGDVWAASFEGGQPELLATGVDGPWATRDERVVWTRSSADESIEGWLGDLLVGNVRHAEPTLRLDRHAMLLEDTGLEKLGDDVLYAVHGGERGGLWRTALP